MATLANYQDFLTELMESHQVVFGFEHPLLSELSGVQRNGDYVVTRDPNQQRFTRAMDGNRSFFHGKKVTIPLQLSDVSSAAMDENDTWIESAPFDTDQATYNLQSRITPIAITMELERQARNGSTSAMESVAAYTESAYRAAARTDEDFLHGSGDALLAAVTGGSSPSLVVEVGTAANFDQLTPGRVVNILTRTNGADAGQGKRRKIASVDRAAGTVTLSTTAVASDGGSGNITFSTGSGLYIDSSYGKAPFGLGNVVSATDTTYGGIDKTAVQQWQGVRVNAGSAPLSDDQLDEAVYYLRGNGVSAPDFGMAHPLTVDPYKAVKTSLVQIEPQTQMVPSGFKGIIYQGADKEFPILKALAAPRKTCRLVTKSSIRIYGDGVAPGFIDDDGTTWRFFSRKTQKEADLFDEWQLCARDCGKNAEIHTLSE